MIFGKKSIEAAARDLRNAVERRDETGYQKALQAVAKAVRTAKRDEVDAAVALFTPLLEQLPYGIGSPLAGIAGSMVEYGTDRAFAVLPTLVERACLAMEDAARFDELYRAAAGESPSPEDHEAVGSAVAALSAAGLPEPEAHRLTEAWFACGDWVQPILYLSQRKEVRLALPQRERLTAAIDKVRESIETAHWLYGLLQVLDDEPVTIVHRATGRGYLVTISGIGDNFQLHTLIAANLIGAESQGLIPGVPPTPAMVAAATDGPVEPSAGIVGQFNLADGEGAWIWNEGRPSDIPLFHGERLIVLDPPAYQRGWNAGRAYPLMRPEFVVRRHLSPEEASERLARVKPDQLSAKLKGGQ